MESIYCHSPYRGCKIQEKNGEYSCLTHKKEICHCGIEFGHHSDIYPVSINPKPNCVKCGNKIPATVRWFEEKGNYCATCNSKFGK